MSRSSSADRHAAFLPVDPPWLQRRGEDEVHLDILVAPRASRTRVLGVHDGRLKVQLAAPPVDGQANDALVRFLADELEVARAHVSIVGGHSNKRKTISLRGVQVSRILLRLSPAQRR